jgi:hypothetical protein
MEAPARALNVIQLVMLNAQKTGEMKDIQERITRVT